MAASVHNIALSSGETIFYREAGQPSNPTVLLLHGFPSSSHQYRNLIPILAAKYHVLAPDLPGFGFTVPPADYVYTFDNIGKTISTWIKEIPNAPAKYTIYIFDYGAPTGLRLALEDPPAVTAIITQNGNGYVEGLGELWNPIKKYWASGDKADREAISMLTSVDFTKYQYTNGAKDASVVQPESYTLDQALLDRPGNADIQLDLFYDYRKNLDLYPKFQEYFRSSQVPVIAVWGKNDQIFIAPGAEAFKKDLPKAEVHLVDAGHFALETNLEEIAGLILPFLEKHAA
jgi:pimeloyl-ACP methyl ester carboxylesterase